MPLKKESLTLLTVSLETGGSARHTWTHKEHQVLVRKPKQEQRWVWVREC